MVILPNKLQIVVFLFMPVLYLVLNTNEVLQAITNLHYLSSMLHTRWYFVEPKHVAWGQIIWSVCNTSFMFKSRIIFPIYIPLHVIMRYWITVDLIKGSLYTNSVGLLDDGRRKEPKNLDFKIQTANVLHFVRRIISYRTEGTVLHHLKDHPMNFV